MGTIFYLVTPIILGLTLARMKNRFGIQALAVVLHFLLQAGVSLIFSRPEMLKGMVTPTGFLLLYGVPAAVLVGALGSRAVRSKPVVIALLTPMVLVAGYVLMTAVVIYGGWIKP